MVLRTFFVLKIFLFQFKQYPVIRGGLSSIQLILMIFLETLANVRFLFLPLSSLPNNLFIVPKNDVIC